MRHLHGAAGRRAGERLPHLGRTGRGAPGDHAARADGPRRGHAPAPGVLPAPRRLAVRLLHPRHDLDLARPGAAGWPSHARGDQVRTGRQPVPLHRLHQDPRRHRGVRRPGGRIMTTADPQTRSAYKVVGTSPAHHDFVDKVKGSLHYAADWQLPGMLHGRIVRSPLPSARITGIDVTAARALPGVAAVLTAADVPSNQIVERASGSPWWPPRPRRSPTRQPSWSSSTTKNCRGCSTSPRPAPTARRGSMTWATPWSAGRSTAATWPARWPPPTWWSRGSTAVSTSSTPTWNPRPGWAGWRTGCSPCACRPRSSSTRP